MQKGHNPNRTKHRSTRGIITCVVLIVVWMASVIALLAYVHLDDDLQIAAAPRVTSNELRSDYERNPNVARARYDHKTLVVFGSVDGTDEGLVGDGCVWLAHNIRCNANGQYPRVRNGMMIAVFGTCQGKDQYGLILLTNCRVLESQHK